MIAADLAAFAAALPHGGRLLGLDLGTKTIGLALADAGWSFATPYETLARTRLTADLARLQAIVTAQQIAGIVLGMPVNMDGTRGPRAQATRAFARDLARALPLPLLFQDERLSTAEATRAMIAHDMSRAKRAARIDSHAAAIILQAALDALAHAR
jgi:putative Holliday junction resolvase